MKHIKPVKSNTNNVLSRIITESPEFFQQLANNIPSLVAVYSVITGEYIFVNNSIKKLLGYTPKEFLEGGIPFVTSLVHPKDLQQIMKKNQEIIKEPNTKEYANEIENSVTQFTYRFKNKKGEWRWLQSDGSIFNRSPDGKIEHVLNISIDVTERILMEENLKSLAKNLETNVKIRTKEIEIQKNQLEIILKNISDGIIVQNNKSHIVYANSAVANLVGYGSVDQLLKSSTQKIIKKFEILDEKGTLYPLEKLLGSLTAQGIQSSQKMIRFRNLKTKEERWSIVSSTPVFDEQKNVIYAITIFHEMTAFKKAEEKVKESEERYKAFITHSSEAIWRFELQKPVSIGVNKEEQIDHFYKYAYLAECNTITANMYGYSKPEDIIGTPLKVFLPRSDTRNVSYLTKFIESHYNLIGAESTELDRDNNFKYFVNNLVGIVENGCLIRAWGTQRDITDRKKIEEEKLQLFQRLQTEQDRRNSMVSNVPGVVWEAYGNPNEAGQQIDFVSTYVEKMLGYKVSEWLSTPNFWLTIVHPEDKKRAGQESMEIFSHKTEGVSRFRWVTKKGNMIWVEARSSVIFDEKKRPIGMRGVTMDISDQIELNRQKDEFLGIASHELRTPLTSLKAYTQVLKYRFEKLGDETSASHLDKMDRQLNKITGLVNDLLDITKIEAGKLQFNQTHFIVEDLLNEVIDQVQLTTEKHLIVRDFSLPFTVFADRDRLGQVVTNLLTNAIKYSPKANKVIVKGNTDSKFITISVQDFGAGISKESFDKIFNRFFRATDTKEKSYPGLGLGLYISKEIITRSGGTIWVESEKEKGSIFSFKILLSQTKKK